MLRKERDSRILRSLLFFAVKTSYIMETTIINLKGDFKMKNFFVDLNRVRKENNENSKNFIKTHPVGYGLYMVGLTALSLAPLATVYVKEKIQKRKVNKLNTVVIENKDEGH